MEKFDVIFCVLTYKNHTDLINFIESFKKDMIVDFSFRIVVVNNFADEESLLQISKVAKSNNCDFIENENKGYSNGNNLGIKFIRENYQFDYLVVCNPDTIIKQFKFSSLKGQEKNIVAPKIICLNGKKQNPMYYSYMPISEKIVYIGLKDERKVFFIIGILINKITRLINGILRSFSKKKYQRIYACHGSYIIFSYYAVEKLSPVFDENIFLFCEESDLARKAKVNNVDIIFNDDIIILHKEDGSMNLSSTNLYKILKASYIYYYEKWSKFTN